MDPTKFTLIASPIALVIIAVIQGYFSLQVAKIHGIVTKVEEQTNSRLTTLLGKVDSLESTIAKNAATRTDEKLDQLSQELKDTKK